MTTDPTITIQLSQFDKMREELRLTNERNQELTTQLATARLTDNSGVIQGFVGAFHQALKIVQFAVGNLSPETVAGWPHEALLQVATAIETLPGIDRHIAELPIELRSFAKNAAGYEAFRRERDARRVVVAASASDYGPQTAEAAFVHQERAKQLGAPHPSGLTSPASPLEEKQPDEQV